MHNPYQQAIDQYQTIELQTQVEAATAHELINLLLQGARKHIAQAQGLIQNKQVSAKGQQISKAISIIEGLRASLNHQHGGEIAVNLDNIYEYVQQILLQANIKDDINLLMEANKLLSKIHEAWQEIRA